MDVAGATGTRRPICPEASADKSSVESAHWGWRRAWSSRRTPARVLAGRGGRARQAPSAPVPRRGRRRAASGHGGRWGDESPGLCRRATRAPGAEERATNIADLSGSAPAGRLQGGSSPAGTAGKLGAGHGAGTGGAARGVPAKMARPARGRQGKPGSGRDLTAARVAGGVPSGRVAGTLAAPASGRRQMVAQLAGATPQPVGYVRPTATGGHRGPPGPVRHCPTMRACPR